MGRAVAGWYPDPLKQNDLRWWDGKRWTENVHPPKSDEGTPPVTPPLVHSIPAPPLDGQGRSTITREEAKAAFSAEFGKRFALGSKAIGRRLIFTGVVVGVVVVVKLGSVIAHAFSGN